MERGAVPLADRSHEPPDRVRGRVYRGAADAHRSAPNLPALLVRAIPVLSSIGRREGARRAAAAAHPRATLSRARSPAVARRPRPAASGPLLAGRRSGGRTGEPG